MSIVFITIPGEARLEFASKLHRIVGNNLKLVVVQVPKKKSYLERIAIFLRRSRRKVLKEMWYALLLRMDKNLTEFLNYFTISTTTNFPKIAENKILKVNSVNGEESLETLRKIAPDLLVVWGNTILNPEILATAKRTINLHFGLCPHYRGALANQDAVLESDYTKIGATIQYINGRTDAGEILATIEANLEKSPKALFMDLNDRALEKFLDISVRLHKREDLPAYSQDINGSRYLPLKSWTPSLRYKLGKKLQKWEQNLPPKGLPVIHSSKMEDVAILNGR